MFLPLTHTPSRITSVAIGVAAMLAGLGAMVRRWVRSRMVT